MCPGGFDNPSCPAEGERARERERERASRLLWGLGVCKTTESSGLPKRRPHSLLFYIYIGLKVQTAGPLPPMGMLRFRDPGM